MLDDLFGVLLLGAAGLFALSLVLLGGLRAAGRGSSIGGITMGVSLFTYLVSAGAGGATRLALEDEARHEQLRSDAAARAALDEVDARPIASPEPTPVPPPTQSAKEARLPEPAASAGTPSPAAGKSDTFDAELAEIDAALQAKDIALASALHDAAKAKRPSDPRLLERAAKIAALRQATKPVPKKKPKKKPAKTKASDETGAEPEPADEPELESEPEADTSD